MRYFGARPLIENGSVTSYPTALVNGRLGYLFENGIRLQLDVLNLFNTQASQIDYYYASQLRNESKSTLLPPPFGYADGIFSRPPR